METITYTDFEKIDIRIGTVTAVEDFPEARKPAYRLWIDFGEAGQVVLLQPERQVLNGLRVL